MVGNLRTTSAAYVRPIFHATMT